jgi:cytochrome c-type biogenesis protein CcmH
VCQNQSIDDSNAPLARDLRLLVRERLNAGDSDEAVISYIVARYGHYVLLKPPLNTGTVLLWFAPVLLISLATIGLYAARRRMRAFATTPPLSDDEKRAIERLSQQ